MRDRDLLPAVKTVSVSFGVEPVYNAITILDDLAFCDYWTGMSEWTYQTAKTLPRALMRQHQVIFGALRLVFYIPDMVALEDCASFPAFIDAFAGCDPLAVRDVMIEYFRQYPQHWAEPDATIGPPPSAAQLLGEVDVYQRWSKVIDPDSFNDDLLAEAHALLNDPPRLREIAVQHMRIMWQEVLAAEWERVLPTLQASVAAFKRLEYNQLTLFEAIRAVTGRDLHTHWEKALNYIEHVIFIPTAHSGPYVNKFISGKTMRLAFTARLPKGIQTGSATLTRAQLLIWLNALSDDSRLRILELLTHEDQLRTQDIIEQIGLSQSVISRHLSQLSATGYLTERREEGIKYYSLNLERLEETTNALLHFLRKK